MDYWNWVVKCANCQTRIEILRPTLLGKASRPKSFPSPDLQMLFLCHECESVCIYTGKQIHPRLLHSTARNQDRLRLRQIRFACKTCGVS